MSDVERQSTPQSVDRFNDRRQLGSIGHVPRAELEAMDARNQESPTMELGLN